MLQLHELLGGLAAAATRASVTSDLASLAIGRQYLEHDLLKHASVPHVQLDELEVALCVAFADQASAETDDDSASKHSDVGSDVLRAGCALTGHPLLARLFADGDGVLKRWISHLHTHHGVAQSTHEREGRTPAARVDALAKPLVDLAASSSAASAPPAGHDSWESAVRRAVQDSFKATAARSHDNSVADEAATEGVPLTVLYGASELQGLPEDRLQRITVRLRSDGRRWVAVGEGADAVMRLVPE